MADPNTEMRRLIDLMEQTNVSEAPMDRKHPIGEQLNPRVMNDVQKLLKYPVDNDNIVQYIKGKYDDKTASVVKNMLPGLRQKQNPTANKNKGTEMPRPRRARRDPLIPLNIGDFVRYAKEMPSLRSLDGSPKRPLHVIKDRELIEKAYKLYLKRFSGVDPLTPVEAILQARESFKNSVTEAPMDIDPVQIMAQRLDQLEKILDAYDPEKFKKIMMENLKGLQKFEAKLLVLEQMIEAVEDSAKRAFDHAQQQHLRLSSLKDYMNRGGDLNKVESVDVSGKPTFKDKYLGGAGDNLPAVNLQGGKKFQAKRARVIGKDWPTDK